MKSKKKSFLKKNNCKLEARIIVEDYYYSLFDFREDVEKIRETMNFITMEINHCKSMKTYLYLTEKHVKNMQNFLLKLKYQEELFNRTKDILRIFGLN